MPPSRPAIRFALLGGLALILCGYLLIGALYAVETPAWQAPDEPAHYNYVRHIVETGRLPVLQPGDYDAAYLERLKAERFPPDLPIDSVRYEAWQPPLYYLLAAPVFALSGGNLLAVRLFTLALGGGVVVLTYLLARTVAPQSAVIPLAAAGFVAFVPQHIAMLAAANNDALAEVIITTGLVLALRAAMPAQLPGQYSQSRPSHQTPTPPYSHTPTRLWPWLGLTLGLAFLTKLSAYPLAALFAAALLLAARRERWDARQSARAAAQVYIPALLIGGAWWARNLAVYGALDFLGLARHDAVVQGQLRTSEAIALWGVGNYLVNFVQTTFQSFWGQFGWMGVVMDRRVYMALLAYSLFLAIGLGGALLAHPSPSGRPWPPQRSGAGADGGEGETSGHRNALALLALHAALTVAVYLYYNLSFVQFQGRYLFPTLPVVGVAAAVGLAQWSRWLAAASRLPARLAARWLLYAPPFAAVALMAALAVFALYRFIVPQLSLLLSFAKFV